MFDYTQGFGSTLGWLYLNHSLCLFSRRQIHDIFFWLFQENRVWRFMQIVRIGDNLYEISNTISWEKYQKYFKMSSAEHFTQSTMR